MDTTVTGDVNVWRSLFSLVLVFGAMGGCFYWVRRQRGFNPGAERRMKVVERLPVDAKRSVLLLTVDGETLLLGVSGEQITLLKSFGSAEKNDDA